MLRTLDPHSNFFDPQGLPSRSARTRRAHYYGVGMQVAPRNGKTVVIAPFPGSPAYKAGHAPRRHHLSVNDKTDRQPDHHRSRRPAERAARHSGQDRGLARGGARLPSLSTSSATRSPARACPTPSGSSPASPTSRCISFNETTSRELDENLKRLGENNIQGPGPRPARQSRRPAERRRRGGRPLPAEGTGDRLAPRPLLAGKAYTSRATAIDGRDYPIVVLVDRYSASAAEIVSGALQDHDRALDPGRDTRSARAWCRPFTRCADSTGAGADHRALLHAQRPPDPARLHQQVVLRLLLPQGRERRNPLDVKMTDSGRTVYGGGGITPDEKFEAPKLDRLQIELLRKQPVQLHARLLRQARRQPAQGLDAGRSRSSSELARIPADRRTASSPKPSSPQDHDWIKRYLAKRDVHHGLQRGRERPRLRRRPIPKCRRPSTRCRRPQALLRERAQGDRAAHDGQQPQPLGAANAHARHPSAPECYASIT